MPVKNPQTTTVLNQLIETCEDGEHGFRHVASKEEDPKLRARFEAYAQQSAQFAIDLGDAVRRLGGDPTDRGIWGGLTTPGWLIVRTRAGEDEAALLAECDYGEAAAEQSYEAALRSEIPREVRALVERQYAEVRKAHAFIQRLEAQHSKPTKRSAARKTRTPSPSRRGRRP